MLQIYLYGENESGFLDLSPGTVLEMQNLLDLFDEDLTAGEFSLPVEIPWTDNNRRKMSFAERIENFQQSKNYWEIDVLDNGFPELIRAKLTILDKEGVLSFKNGKFNASVSGNKGLFGSIIKNKKLRDLQLGGVIKWEDISSREFATKVMKGEYPEFSHIAFAPVAIENFFDTTKSYNDEFIAKDTVNWIVPADNDDINDWKFARVSPTGPEAVDEGNAQYLDYRTIPFLNFKYVLVQAFQELGYTVSGEIVNSNDFNDLYIFNNQAIDFFSTSVYLDYNRKINPADHVPDLTLVDFFKKVFSFFNIFPVIGATSVELKYRRKTFTDRKIIDITKYCNPNFKSTFQQVTDDSGYTMSYSWDGNDSYKDDRIKDRKQKKLVATVVTAPNLGTLDIGRPLTTDDMVYVQAENMYYIVADSTSSPILWDAWTEGLDDYIKGEGGRQVDLGMGTLATYVEFNEADALYERRNRVGCRMKGSYWTNKQRQIKSPFGLSVFYIKKTIVDGKNVPLSFNHNTSIAGVVLEKFSLALNATKGIGTQLHKNWQDVQEINEIVKVSVNANKKLLTEINAANTIQIHNILFLPKQTETTIPHQDLISMDLVPI